MDNMVAAECISDDHPLPESLIFTGRRIGYFSTVHISLRGLIAVENLFHKLNHHCWDSSNYRISCLMLSTSNTPVLGVNTDLYITAKAGEPSLSSTYVSYCTARNNTAITDSDTRGS